MRWTYLVPRLIIVGLLWAFFAFAFDPLLRYSAQSAIQTVTGAKADVPQFSTGFFPPRLSVETVALASRRKPGTNIVEFGELRCRFAGDPLLRKSYVIDEAVVTGVRFGTSRNDSGQLESADPDEDSEPTIPPWLTQHLRDRGDEWLDDLTDQAKQKLDPNILESYRVGNELYEKWDERFEEVNRQLATAKADLESIKSQIKLAKEGETIERIEKYLEVAHRADLLMRQSRDLLARFRRDVPLELRQDYARLDQARKNDQEMAANTIRMLKPDARRITESIIGDEMYVQLQQLLSWIELLRDYQKELKSPAPAERHRGFDFEFPLLNPTPRLLCRRMEISGEMMVSDIPTPFSAVLTGLTSDPKLHGKPALLTVSTKGATPVEVVIRHDATGDMSITDVGVDYTDAERNQITVGKEQRSRLSADLSNMHWMARLNLTGDQISGRIDVTSDLTSPHVEASHRYGEPLANLVEQTLSEIKSLQASLKISGTIRQPDVAMTSSIGEQFVTGFNKAFASFIPQVKNQLIAEVNTYVDEKKAEFTQKYGAKYQDLLDRQKKILDGLQEVHQIAMNARNGKLEPDRVFRLASESGVLKEKDQKKAEKYFGTGNKIMQGLQNPERTIQDAIPGLRRKLFK